MSAHFWEGISDLYFNSTLQGAFKHYVKFAATFFHFGVSCKTAK